MAQRLSSVLSSVVAEVRRACLRLRTVASGSVRTRVEQTLRSSRSYEARATKQRSRRLRTLLGAASSLIVLVLASCDGAPLGTRLESCRALCAKLETCDDKTDLEGCERGCSEQRVRSEAYLTARALCAEQSSCNLWVDELGAMGEDRCGEEACFLNDCTDDALSAQSQSGAESAYCARAVSKLSACDMRVDAEVLSAHCARLFPALSSEYLIEMQVCIEADCSTVAACLDGVGDRYNTELTLYPVLSPHVRDAATARLPDF